MNMYIHRCTHLTCDRMIVHLILTYISLYIYIDIQHIYIYSYYPPKDGIIVKITDNMDTIHKKLPFLRSLRLDSSERWLLRSQKKPQRFRKAQRCTRTWPVFSTGTWPRQMFLGELKPRLPVA